MKRLPITEGIKQAMKRVNGGAEIDYNSVAVYETRTINTMKLRKRGGLYQGARVDRSLLEGMVASLNNSAEGVPMHTMHNTQLLNVGKAFRATLYTRPDGHDEVATQFYIPLTEEALIGRLDASVVDQVSVGLMGEKIQCSECDFDWKTDAKLKNYAELTCKNGHTIGKDGTHVISKGLESWYELSFVDNGAAQDARIVNADQSRFVDADEFYKLAASNQNNPETAIPLIANLSETFSEEPAVMTEDDVKKIVAAALAAQAEAAKTGEADAALAAAQAELATANARIAELEAAATPPAEVAEVQAKLTAAEAELGTAVEFLKAQAKAAKVAAGDKDAAEPETLDASIKAIEDGGVMIAKLFARKETEMNAPKPDTNAPSLRAFARPKK